MRHVCLTFALLGLGLLTACGDDDGGGDATFQIAFEARVGVRPFECGSIYRAIGSEFTEVEPIDFRFYVHDVALVTADGTEVPLTLDDDGEWQYQGVALLDFEDFTGACQDGTAETNTSVRGRAPAGDYTGVAFSLGVPASLNHQDLTALPAPLNLSGLYWSWGLGRVFMAVGSRAGAHDLHVHVGSTGCVGDPAAGDTITCDRPNRTRYVITGFDPKADKLVADWAAILASSPLSTAGSCHSFPADSCPAPFAAVGIDFATGAPAAAQTFLRVAE